MPHGKRRRACFAGTGRHRSECHSSSENKSRQEEKTAHRIQTFRSLHEQQDHDYCPSKTYSWGGDYRPKTRAGFIFLEDAGFLLTMRCQERDPRRRLHSGRRPRLYRQLHEAFLNLSRGKRQRPPQF